jgi:hypothetical protein
MNIFNGYQNTDYEKMDWRERKIRQDAANNSPAATTLPAKCLATIAKDCVDDLETLATIGKAFRKKNQDIEALCDTKAFFEKTQQAAFDSGDAMANPQNKQEIQNRLRTQRRSVERAFTDEHYTPYYSAISRVTAKAVATLEKLIIAEDDADLAKLKAYGLKQSHPCPVVASLLGLLSRLERDLEFTKGFLESGPATMNSLNVNPELLALFGVNI